MKQVVQPSRRAFVAGGLALGWSTLAPAAEPAEPAAKGAAPPATVFVCDATGTMLTRMEAVKQDLLDQVEGLADRQRFNAILFQDQDVHLYQAKGWATNSSVARGKLKQWLAKFEARGTTDAVIAITAAFKLKPQEIVLVSDFDMDPDEFAARVNKLNPDRAVKLHTVYFVTNIGGAHFGAPFAKRLAAENGGTCRVVEPPAPPAPKK